MKRQMTMEETIKYLDEKIRYAECLKKHLIACQEYERNQHKKEKT